MMNLRKGRSLAPVCLEVTVRASMSWSARYEVMAAATLVGDDLLVVTE